MNDFIKMTDVNTCLVAAVPYLSVMYSGGVLHIQSHAPSTETLFHFIQSAALLAAGRLQERTKTKQH